MASQHSDFRLFVRLLQQARPFRFHILGILALDLLGAPIALLMPLPLKLTVDSLVGSMPLPGWFRSVLPQAASDHGLAALIAVAIFMVLATLLLYGQSLAAWLLQTYTGERLVLEFRARLFRHLQRLSLSYHDRKGSADSTYRVQYDADSIQHIVVTGFTPFIAAVTTLGSVIYVTLRIDWQLALVALGICPILVMLTRVSGGSLRRLWPQVKDLDSSSLAVVQEVLGAMRVVKAFGAEEQESKRFLSSSRQRMRGELRIAFLEGGFDLLIAVTIAIGTASALLLGVLHIRSGVLSLGQMLMVMTYLAEIYEPLKTISKSFGDLQGALAGAERVFAVIDELPEVTEIAQPRPLIRAAGAVAFQDVSFSYDHQRLVLNKAQFEIPARTRVGIVGETGAGKTTVLNLLIRFYDPLSGRILLDGIDLREYRIADLRNQFALVLQEPHLFSTSIRENIAYGRPGASHEEIERAARAANAHDFITRLPDGYETKLGERGVGLSLGERQRISLARAFLKDAPILILDEPTSSVDVNTEAVILDAMSRLIKGRTSFIISHRAATLVDCDLALRIEKGQVYEMRIPSEVAV